MGGGGRGRERGAWKEGESSWGGERGGKERMEDGEGVWKGSGGGEGVWKG